MLVAACVLPAIAVTVVLLVLDFQSGRAALMHDAMLTARGLMTAVDTQFLGAEASMLVLSGSLPLKNGDLAAFYD